MLPTLTGQTAPTEAGENTLAHRADGTRVIVGTTHEAIRDCGWSEIADVASDKYDRNELTPEGPPANVRVIASYCAA
jgi:hypothetical protein